jgi:hypothetical protein
VQAGDPARVAPERMDEGAVFAIKHLDGLVTRSRYNVPADQNITTVYWPILLLQNKELMHTERY